MGYIYLISNDVNDLLYVGITKREVELRWKEHLRHKINPLSNAIKLIGKEHFCVKIIEECEDDFLDEREQYWIKYYDSYNHGYNMTIGGRSNKTLHYPEKLKQTKELWDEGYGQKAIAQKLSLNIETTHNYLLKNGITIENIKERHKKLIGKSKSKKILQYDLESNFIKEWNSIAEINRSKVASKASVGRCLNNTKASACGYIWKYKGEEGE